METSLFEDKEITDINSQDFESLIGREETQRLEFKETLDAVDSYELAKDLASLSNGGGGYIVVGAVEDRKTKTCTGFQSVQNVEVVRNKIRDVGLERIDERLIPTIQSFSLTSGAVVVLALIPQSVEPCAVTYDKRKEYWKRFGKDKRHMKHAEIFVESREEKARSDQRYAKSIDQIRELIESVKSMLKEPRHAAIVNAFQLADEVLRFAETHPTPSREQHYVRAIAGARVNVFADLNQRAIEEYVLQFRDRLAGVIEALAKETVSLPRPSSEYLQPLVYAPISETAKMTSEHLRKAAIEAVNGEKARDSNFPKMGSPI